MPSFEEIFQGIVRGGVAVLGMVQFQTFLKLDRNLAMQDLTTRVQTLSAAQLDEFEASFLKSSLAVIDPAQRIRSMELYAWLKIQETLAYERFRGFCTAGDPLS
jgi:hypothetical protein